MPEDRPPVRRRPALRVAACLALGVAVAPSVPCSAAHATVAAAAAWLACLGCRRVRNPAVPVTCALMACAALVGMARAKAETTPDLRGAGRYLAVGAVTGFTGVVLNEPEWLGDRSRVEIGADSLRLEGEWYPASGKVLLRLGSGLTPPPYGARLRVETAVTPPSPARNPGAFDYAAYLSLRGIDALAYARRPQDVRVVGEGQGPRVQQDLILPVRARIRGLVDRNLSGGPAGLLKGVLLGDKRSVPDEVREAFTRAGVNHVLAVSGLHVGLIAGVVFFGLRTLGLGRVPCGLATLGGIALYAVVTGSPPSVVRAGVTAAVLILGGLRGREGDSLNALGFAAIVILVVRPMDLFTVGFQLSFAATGAILLLHGPIRAWLPVRESNPLGKWIATPLAVSLAAQAGTAPLVAGTFGVMSVVAPAANLVVVPLVAAGAAVGLVTVIVGGLFEPAATVLNGANWLLLSGAIRIARYAAQPAWAQVTVPPIPWEGVALFVGGLALLVPEIRRRRAGTYVLMGMLVVGNAWVWHGRHAGGGALAVTALDVGQGDGIFLEFPNGRTMLVDAGLRAPGYDAGERVVVPFLRSRGIRRVDVVVASHPHADHVGGLISVLENVAVGHYLDAGQHYDSWTARRIRELIVERGVRYTAVAAGDSLVGLGGVGAVVLHPTGKWVSTDAEAPHGVNNGSVAVAMSYGGKRLLLTGDLEHETDRAIIRWGARSRADILKAAHHGSRTSSTEAFVAHVAPSEVIVSCGVRNKFRHPAPEVIARYEAAGARVHRTDRHGAVQFRWRADGGTIRRWLAPEHLAMGERR